MIRADPDTDARVRTAVRFLNEAVQHNANEPSLALYRIQEHVQRTFPPMVQKRGELVNLQEQMSGLVFDIEYGIEAVQAMGTSVNHVNNIVGHLEKARQISQQINLFRQNQVQQQLFEKKDGPLSASLKN